DLAGGTGADPSAAPTGHAAAGRPRVPPRRAHRRHVRLRAPRDRGTSARPTAGTDDTPAPRTAASHRARSRFPSRIIHTTPSHVLASASNVGVEHEHAG